MAACVLALVLALTLAFPLAGGPAPAPLYHECYDPPFLRGTPHEPIHINGDDNFTAANGVDSGDGSPKNPYLIEGWRIYPNVTAGILIENTDSYVTVQGVVICGGVHTNPPQDGVQLSHVANVRVVYSDLPFNRVAVSVRNSSAVTLEDDWTHSGYPDDFNRPLPYRSGIEVVDSSRVQIDAFSTSAEYVRYPTGISLLRTGDIVVSDTYLDGVQQGIRFDRTSNITIVKTRVPSSVQGPAIVGRYSSNVVLRQSLVAWGPGVELNIVANVTIAQNTFESNAYGLSATRVANLSLVGNTFTGSGSWVGAGIGSSTDVAVVGNEFSTNAEGLILAQSAPVQVYHNSFLTKGCDPGFPCPQASDDRGAENQWNDWYPSGGNYWSDYRGLDQKSGALQDQPGSDGIGDVPYEIPSNARDRYPYMRPGPWMTNYASIVPWIQPSPPLEFHFRSDPPIRVSDATVNVSCGTVTTCQRKDIKRTFS